MDEEADSALIPAVVASRAESPGPKEVDERVLISSLSQLSDAPEDPEPCLVNLIKNSFDEKKVGNYGCKN